MSKETKDKKLTFGTVTSISGENTVKVRIESTLVSKLYSKRYKAHKSFLVDSKDVKVEVGDGVLIEETMPISKKKRHKINKKIS